MNIYHFTLVNCKPVSEDLFLSLCYFEYCVFYSLVTTLHINLNTIFIFSFYQFHCLSYCNSLISLRRSLNLHLLDLIHRKIFCHCSNHKWTRFYRYLTHNRQSSAVSQRWGFSGSDPCLLPASRQDKMSALNVSAFLHGYVESLCFIHIISTFLTRITRKMT